ncbi:MAG TPA: DUF1700 domain-containing protein [Rhizomicrobium sp.]|nr:DUF1700 domain-containing protein [Rhizomicrobium sp.]
MSRALFLARLRQGLKGLSPGEIDEIVTDYEAHFSDALAAGRSEIDVAASLGDPLQLGNELRAETRLRRWENRRSPHNFVQAGLGLVGLQAFNLFILLPVLLVSAGCALIAAYVLYIVGSTGVHLLGGLLSGNGNVLVTTLVGVGLIAGVIGIGSILALLLGGGLSLLGRYVRLNYRLLKPEDQNRGNEE